MSRAAMLSGAASLSARVVVGTVLFIVVLAAVQSRDARIAGMMLTFPALNGISLLMAPITDKRAMARAMLPTIALNGLAAIAFIEAYELLAQKLGPAATGWVWPLSVLAFIVWLIVCWLLARGPPATERLMLFGFMLVAPVLIVAWWVNCPLAAGSASAFGFGGLVAMHMVRIVLFALTLALLLAAAEWLRASHVLIGRLGAFPVLPLFSLATIAESLGATPDSLARIAAIEPAMLLGLLLAMAFAWLYSGYLMWLRAVCAAGFGWWAGALAGLIGGWALCACIIFGGMGAVAALEGCR